MFFLMQCHHHPGRDADRDRLRPLHRDWVAGGGGVASVLIGSAMWAEDGTAIGHWGVIEATTPHAARAFAEGDPFYAGGVVATVSMTRLADGFQAHRISDRMTKEGV